MNKVAKKYCQTCGSYKDCPYLLRNLERKCPQLSDFEYGFEQGFKEAVERIREWANEEKEMMENIGLRVSIDDVISYISKLEEEYE